MTHQNHNTMHPNSLDYTIIKKEDMQEITFMAGDHEVVILRKKNREKNLIDIDDIVRLTRRKLHFLNENDDAATRRVVDRVVRTTLAEYVKTIGYEMTIFEENTIVTMTVERFFMPLPEDIAAKRYYESLSSAEQALEYRRNASRPTWGDFFAGRKTETRTWSQWFRGVKSRDHPRRQA